MTDTEILDKFLELLNGVGTEGFAAIVASLGVKGLPDRTNLRAIVNDNSHWCSWWLGYRAAIRAQP